MSNVKDFVLPVDKALNQLFIAVDNIVKIDDKVLIDTILSVNEETITAWHLLTSLMEKLSEKNISICDTYKEILENGK